MTTAQYYFLIRVRILNANAISSAITHGFPAMSHFLGAMHRLERKLQDEGSDISFSGIGVSVHSFEEQCSDVGYGRLRFIPMRHPVGQDGGSASIMESGRIHLDVTLVFGVRGGSIAKMTESERGHWVLRMQEYIGGMRIAGGSVVEVVRSGTGLVAFDDTEQLQKLKRKLFPGFSLVSRRTLMKSHLSELRQSHPEATPLDVLFDLCALHIEPESFNDDALTQGEDDVAWRASRREKGWLVPIPVGFLGISELYEPGVVSGSRDPEIPFRFVESAVSLGEWISPHRVSHLKDLLWRYDADPVAGLYLCSNDYELNQ